MRKIVLFFSVAALAFTSVMAHKSTKPLNECIASLDNLIVVSSSVTSLTSKEQAGLIKIASDAKNLILTGKTDNGLKKLLDYQVKLDQLAATLGNPTPKIRTSDEEVLRTALNEAIACVSGG